MARLGDVFPLIRNGASIKQTDGAGGYPITRIETIATMRIIKLELIFIFLHLHLPDNWDLSLK